MLPKGSEWRYHTGAQPPEQWSRPVFEPETWPRGKAPLGYGESEIVTTIPSGPDPDQKWAASYFLARFGASTSRAYSKVRLKVRRDDGILIFLNGTEVLRDYLGDSPSWDTYADSEVGGIEEQLYYVTEIEPDLLRKENVIAVQVHQCNGGSSDVFFDMTVEALID